HRAGRGATGGEASTHTGTEGFGVHAPVQRPGGPAATREGVRSCRPRQNKGARQRAGTCRTCCCFGVGSRFTQGPARVEGVVAELIVAPDFGSAGSRYARNTWIRHPSGSSSITAKRE